ncbi:ssDNA-binding domain of telomere protection protein domain-containing protein [Ditylenchus destructor]|uniref:SsDNA-binding domain of telomere protection protein domain-containing protein n=1 Tax=Ditylenchus destructor TaxID=166010 RepID=A0AAD4N527_9BILA|nr:ssDNA-binding domain of telomere protection protein domain-containing protein [Ditylenchus destructor]
MQHPGFDPHSTTCFLRAMNQIKDVINAAKSKHKLVNISSFENIQVSTRKGFYDCVCQIIGVFVQRNETQKRTYLRVTDGTILSGNTPISKVVDVDLQKSKCDVELEDMLKSVVIDICCWDEFSAEAMKYKPGDIVKLGNIQVKVLNCVVLFDLNGVDSAPTYVSRFAKLRGITFLEHVCHPQPGSRANENMPPHALSDVDTDSNFHLPIADSLAGSPEIAQRGQQNSEDWESVVNDSFSEQQTNQEESSRRNFITHQIFRYCNPSLTEIIFQNTW